MMLGDLHRVVVVGMHPESNPGHHDDRWMVTYPRGL
jgi:carbamoylphosphate synthase small subunit